MAKKRAIISRHGAYGDMIHMSFLPHLLKDEGFDEVHVDTNFKGTQILSENPYIDKIFNLTPDHSILNERPDLMVKHLQSVFCEYDKHIHLLNSLEYGCLAMEDEEVYYMCDAVRRKRYGNINFYDQTCAIAGYIDKCGEYNGEVYYTQEEHDIVSRWMEKFSGKWTVMVNISGTGPHKRFVNAQSVCEEILRRYPDAHIITTGDELCKDKDLKLDRMTSTVGKMPFRQSLLIAKHVGLVIGCESGLMVGASMWGTPAVQLLTAANKHNHVKYAKNDYSIQSPAYCSPCHKGPYRYIGCPHKDGSPLCVYFPDEMILQKVGEAYAARA